MSRHADSDSILRYRLTRIGIPLLKIRRSRDRLISNMGIPIPGKDSLYTETGPRSILNESQAGRLQGATFNIKTPSYQYRNSHYACI